ncbi:condensin-2 complex subunit H2-like isoform X2 [Daphnia carinata]|uniref:condensin-2 complex subunit H2-like isoform X2 n=1 Tax=Daphnia carinata TaxID=120202 RepID=UPI00257CF8AF|nr:condensin-2 complex subunit H2-like isoform X2 [Daphnia carinata]
MSQANLSGSSVEEDDVFSSQFAALLKPIRELTKQGFWELNIADKLEEYVQYIQDLRIEVNVNGEQMKLDFAKAAMVVQNSTQIYSKKVEQLWLLLQEVIEFLSSNGNINENEENQISGAKPKKNSRRRHHKGDIDLLTEPVPLKFRKFGSKLKKRGSKDTKKMQILPYEILQLEEVIGSSNPLKIKLYTLSNEHLGYPSDLRSNFPFDPHNLFLKIHHAYGIISHSETHGENQGEHCDADLIQNEPIAAVTPINSDEIELEDQIPNLDDWQNDVDHVSGSEIIPPAIEEHENSIDMNGRVVDRMRLRDRIPPPIPSENQEVIDPWSGLEPYSDGDTVAKPCGLPIRCKVPLSLRKRKEVGKEPKYEESLVDIDEFLGKCQMLKKPVLKCCQPDPEFWEDYVHFTKTTGTTIKKQQKIRPERNIPAEIGELHRDDLINNNDEDNDGPDGEDRFNDSGALDFSSGSFHAEDPVGSTSPTRELDESKQFFELVQQFMAEYTASAKEFVTSTESTRRVQAWHEMIQPRLQEAESRRDFDIHLYGSRIIEEFGSKAAIGSQCSFTKIVRDQPKNEVARYFLATLQLANAYNVEIQLQDALSLDGVELKLLSRERHHEHIDGFV